MATGSEKTIPPGALRSMDQPLGLGPVQREPWRLTRNDLATGIVGIAIFAASGAIALREQPFRTPVQTVVSIPTTADTTAAEAATTAREALGRGAAQADGPSIIKVTPGGNGSGGSLVTIEDPSRTVQDPRVAHLPDRALIEDSATGPLPKRAADGRRPFDVYARPWSGARGARVAIVIGGLGVSQTGTQLALQRLPPEVTLAFASGGNSLDRWMQTARQSGHEIVVQVPLEPFDYPTVDPGRGTLEVDAEPAQNRESLHWTLGRLTNYVGIMNYMGGRFVTENAAMTPLMKELGERGLLYLDDGASARSLAEPLAKANGTPFAASDMVIDANRSRGDVLAKLDALEREARAQGFAVGTGSAFEVTVDAVATWAAEAKKRGIELVPITAVANDPERS